MGQFTIEDLQRIMRESAGEDEGANLDGDVLDRTFNDLGYDSLAVLETASRVERTFAISLPEEELADVQTPRDFVAFVNTRLTQRV